MATEGQTVTGEWTMEASESRARCLGLINDVAETVLPKHLSLGVLEQLSMLKLR